MASGRTDVSPRSAMNSVSIPSPRTGSSAAPVILGSSTLAPRNEGRLPLLLGQLSSSSLNNTAFSGQASASSLLHNNSLNHPSSIPVGRRRRSHSGEQSMMSSPGRSTATTNASPRSAGRKPLNDASTALAKARSRSAQKANDAMVYLDGPQVYTCAQCRTHLTSHDEIISKSFHGRHGRAYLFDHCVNVTIGPAEDRLLITGMHSVCDIFCKRCKNLVGWTYARAYEASQKYKEGKFIIEKINLHLEESDYYDVAPPAGERKDRFRARSMSWGSDCPQSPRQDIIYEYRPTSPLITPRGGGRDQRDRVGSFGKGESPLLRRPRAGSNPPPPPPAWT